MISALNAAFMHGRRLYGQKVKTIDEFFDAVDKDGGDSIDREELSGALKRLGLGLKKEHIDILMEVFDEDGGGEIERDEFREKLEWAGWGKKQKLPWEMASKPSEFAQKTNAAEASYLMAKNVASWAIQDTGIVYDTAQTFHKGIILPSSPHLTQNLPILGPSQPIVSITVCDLVLIPGTQSQYHSRAW